MSMQTDSASQDGAEALATGTDDLRIRAITPLSTPEAVMAEYPISPLSLIHI